MSNQAFDELKKNVGGLISFNSFLSTTADRTVGLGFAISNVDDPDSQAVLFVIDVDPTVSISSPFASLDETHTIFIEECEYLWGMNTIFRINSIQQMDNYVWEVKLCVTSDDDPQLKELTDYMRQDITGITGHKRLAQLMIRMSEWARAKEIYESLLPTSDNNDPTDIAFLHHQLGYIARQRGDLNDAVQHYQKVLALDLTRMPADDRRLVSVYTNIALVLHHKGDLDQALQQYNRALNIEEHANQPDKGQLAALLQNIGSVLQEQGHVYQALQSYLRVSAIQESYLPAMYPHRARTFNSIAVISAENGDFLTALTYFDNALTIQERSLPQNHIELAIIHSNMADCLTSLGQFKDALNHAIKARNTAHHTLPPNHPNLEEFENDVIELESML